MVANVSAELGVRKEAMLEPATPDDAGDSGMPDAADVVRGADGPPRPPVSIIARPRLFDELDRASEFPLAILRGPGGSGKTSLLLDWISRSAGGSERRTRWLDGTALPAGGHLDRDAFWAAVLRVLSGNGAEGPPGADPLPSGSRLVDMIRNQVDVVPVLLVVDGWEGAVLPGVADEVMAVAAAVPRLRWMVTTQTTGHLERRGTLDGLDVAVIGPESLRLTVDETEELLGGSPLAGEAAAVWRLSAGSPRFSRALLARAADRGTAPRGTVEEAAAAVVDDLRSLLASGTLPPGMLRFMERTSVPEEVPVGLAEVLAADADAPSHLNAAARHGHGDWTGRGSFAYVPLVRTALLAEFERNAAGDVSSLNRECARYLTLHGNPRAALRHALAAQDLDAATGVLRRYALHMADASERESTIETLRGIGSAKLARYPIVAMVLALAYMSSGVHRAKGLEMLAAAMAGVRNLAKGLPPPDRMLLSMLEVVALRVGGRVATAEAVARRALARYEALSDDDLEAIGDFEGTMLAHFALTLVLAGHTESAGAVASRAVTASARRESAAGEGYALGVAACVNVAEGDFRQAALLVRRSIGTGWIEREPSAYATTPLRLAQAAVEFERLDLAAGREALAPILSEAETSEFWPHIVSMATMFDLLAGDAALSLGKLRAVLSRQRNLPPTNPAGQWALDAAAGWLHLALGDGAAALRAVGRYREKSGAQALMRARIHLARGQSEAVLHLTARVTDGDSPRQRFDAGVLALAVRLRLGDTEDTERRLRELAGMSSVFNLVSPVALLPAPDLERVRAAAGAHGVALGVPDGFRALVQGDLAAVDLTAREAAVLRELEATGNAAAIAAVLFVSVNTVKSQLRSLYRKLGASSRNEALSAARHYGLLNS